MKKIDTRNATSVRQMIEETLREKKTYIKITTEIIERLLFKSEITFAT